MSVRPRWGRGGRERGVDACPQVTPRRGSGITQRLLLKCDLFEVELVIGGRSSGCGGGGVSVNDGLIV